MVLVLRSKCFLNGSLVDLVRYVHLEVTFAIQPVLLRVEIMRIAMRDAVMIDLFALLIRYF